jgi:hypothetical protein
MVGAPHEVRPTDSDESIGCAAPLLSRLEHGGTAIPVPCLECARSPAWVAADGGEVGAEATEEVGVPNEPRMVDEQQLQLRRVAVARVPAQTSSAP